ncbi:MAG: hypothetical protein WD750_08605 [Gammaproteobacteria bacterium]
MPDASRRDLDRCIEAVEAGYEFLLAYAAQGHESDRHAGAGGEVRRYLADMDEALNGLGELALACAEQVDGESVTEYRGFLDALDADARKARAAVRLVLSRDDISSQLVDNLNASSHLRALLTDLFLIDEALKASEE